MTKPRKRQQSPPLKTLADRQKHGDVNRLVSATEAEVRAAFADAQARVQPLLQQFAAAYGAEQQRLAELHDDPQARVPLLWLTTSGWRTRLTHALLAAQRGAAHDAERAILHAMGSARGLGREHARALLTLAMRPAVKAGMRHWRPK